MAVADQTLTCRECGGNFTFTAGEQAFYAQKGYTHMPARCYVCRAIARPPKPARPPRRVERSAFTVTCAGCGGEATVPFKPTQGRPVLCDACFRSRR